MNYYYSSGSAIELRGSPEIKGVDEPYGERCFA